MQSGFDPAAEESSGSPELKIRPARGIPLALQSFLCLRRQSFSSDAPEVFLWRGPNRSLWGCANRPPLGAPEELLWSPRGIPLGPPEEFLWAPRGKLWGRQSWRPQRRAKGGGFPSKHYALEPQRSFSGVAEEFLWGARRRPVRAPPEAAVRATPEANLWGARGPVWDLKQDPV